MLPHSFYGRAVLILIVPIIMIQIVLSVVFIQRHYERVTAQMTTNVLHDLRFVLVRMDASPAPQAVLDDLSDLLNMLQIRIEITDLEGLPFLVDRIERLDLAGREIVRTLRAEMDRPLVVDLQRRSGAVELWLTSVHGVLQVSMPRRIVTSTNPHQLLVIVFLASALMALIAFQFLRLQVRPIRRLGAAAEAYGRGERVPLRAAGAREIRAAAHAFIDMRNRIERQRLQHKVMLSGVSHDMRTPLTRMRLILSMMEEGEDRAALEIEISDLETRLNSFLDYTRGHVTEEEQVVAPRDLVRDLVDRYQNAGTPITFAPVASAPEHVVLQPGQVERALDNLISNALRHGAQVRISLGVQGKSLEFSVEDDGPSIPEADRARACEPFVRLDEARNFERGGVGLGLAIAAEAARSHGGAFVLDDSPALGGLRARLRVPLKVQSR